MPAKLSSRSTVRKNQAGFTLIELVIVAGLLSVLLIAVSSMFMATLTSNLKTSSRQQMKEEGGYVLGQMEFLIRNATKLDQSTPALECAPGMSSIKIVNADGGTTEFALNGSQIASNGAVLHSNLLVASNLNFDCDRNTGGEYYIDIGFSLTRTETNITENFQHIVLMRNK